MLYSSKAKKLMAESGLSRLEERMSLSEYPAPQADDMKKSEALGNFLLNTQKMNGAVIEIDRFLRGYKQDVFKDSESSLMKELVNRGRALGKNDQQYEEYKRDVYEIPAQAETAIEFIAKMHESLNSLCNAISRNTSLDTQYYDNALDFVKISDKELKNILPNPATLQNLADTSGQYFQHTVSTKYDDLAFEFEGVTLKGETFIQNINYELLPELKRNLAEVLKYYEKEITAALPAPSPEL